MPIQDPPLHATGLAKLVVADSDLASTLASEPGEDYPRVFATTRMIGLMELAAGRVLLPILSPGELSVGVVVDVRHTAATLPGATVRAEAKYLGRSGKLYRFEVVATDDGGEVGRGIHERAIVRVERLLDGAAKRGRSP